MHSVLMVDDERIERDFLNQVILECADRYAVVGEAENGNQAVAMAKSLCPDIVLMDITMPQCSGLEAAREIKTHAPDTIIILNSAYAEFNFAQQAIAYDVDAYLVKPAGKELIISTLDCSVQKRRILAQPTSAVRFLPAKFYPYELTDKLLLSIESRNVHSLRTEADTFCQFFEACYSDFEHYRIFIIDTIFNIGRKLQNSQIPAGLAGLLGEHAYLEKISRANTWFEVLTNLKEFFTRLAMLLEGCNSLSGNQIDVVADYIDKHYGDELTLAGLAAIALMSPNYLSRRFHQEKGISLRKYITACRVEKAKKLLTSSCFSIEEIARACGFAGQSYFQNVCKKYTGRTPAEIRRGVPDKG